MVATRLKSASATKRGDTGSTTLAIDSRGSIEINGDVKSEQSESRQDTTQIHLACIRSRFSQYLHYHRLGHR